MAELSPESDVALVHVPAPLELRRAIPLTRFAGFDPLTVKPKNTFPARSAVRGVEICTALLNTAWLALYTFIP